MYPLRISFAGAVIAHILSASTVAQQVYLNDANISVALGASMAPEPFQNRSTVDSLASVIDAPGADVSEDHRQDTHVWVSGGILEIDFDLGREWDLQTLHFWNYFTEAFDVDNVDFVFFDALGNQVGQLLGVAPALGGAGGNPIFAENYPLSFPARVQFVNAILSGSNGEVDFNNIGFTGLSSCGTTPIRDNFGSGWSGTNGVPGLTLDNFPMPGSTVNLFVGNESGVMAPTCLILGAQALTTPTSFGGSILVELQALVPLMPVPPVGINLVWPISLDATLCGAELFAQAVQFDVGASAGVAFSRGLRIVVGLGKTGS